MGDHLEDQFIVNVSFLDRGIVPTPRKYFLPRPLFRPEVLTCFRDLSSIPLNAKLGSLFWA